jgi:uncharacterized protein DUF3597
MSLFKDLMSKIFSHAPVATAAPVAPKPAATTGTAVLEAPPVPVVDVAAVLNDLAATTKEKLDWEHSIVDLMKLVGMDSSFGARKKLATELNFTGDMNDSASMNVWLHKQVLRKLAENGGKVPANLLS